MAQHVFKLDPVPIRAKLAQDVSKMVTSNDLALQGLLSFAIAHRMSKAKEFGTKEIVEWAMNHDDFKECELLVNTRKLGIYMKTQAHMVRQVSGLYESGMKMNKTVYSLDLKIIKALIEESQVENEKIQQRIRRREEMGEMSDT